MKDIIPFCAYQYINPATNSFWGYIDVPNKIYNPNNDSFSYNCPKTESNKNLLFSFFAVAPNFRPIPSGMKLFCAKKSLSYPFTTSDVNIVYDPYDIKEDCVYFITYNQPVPNTVPLYFHKLGLHVFPSLDKNPPSKNKNWTQTNISPIFVFTKETLKNTNTFSCINGSCISLPKNMNNVLQNDTRVFNNLSECVVYCNETILAKNQQKPQSLIEYIKSESLPTPDHFKVFKMILAILILLLIVIILIKLGFKQKKLLRYRF